MSSTTLLRRLLAALLLGVELELGNADAREQDGCLDACEVEGRRLGAAKPEMTVVVGEVRAEDVGREAGLLGPATGPVLEDRRLLALGWVDDEEGDAAG